jgi:hypothetical protein
MIMAGMIVAVTAGADMKAVVMTAVETIVVETIVVETAVETTVVETESMCLAATGGARTGQTEAIPMLMFATGICTVTGHNGRE